MLSSDARLHYFNTVWCIAASPYVSEFMIGYTRRAGRDRLAEYWKIHGYQYLVVLADGLSLADARALERHLQESIWGSKKSTIFYKKYNPDRRDGRHFASIGPTSGITPDCTHSIYMAWREGQK